MRVRGQPAAARDLSSKTKQVVFVEPTFHERSRVNSRRRVALKVDHVAGVVVGSSVEEMVEADFVKRRTGSERRNVPADSDIITVRPNDHRHRVPTNDTLDTPLKITVAGVRRLILSRDCVDVRSVCSEGQMNSALVGSLLKQRQHLLNPLAAVPM